MNIKAVIFAGGSGTRLWPVSRENSPKQVRPFLDDETLLQKTFKRLEGIVGINNIFLSTNSSLVDEVLSQTNLPQQKIFSEPLKKDTAPAMGYAALRLSLIDPEAIMVNAWSDHYIKNVDLYRKVFAVAEEFISKNPSAVFMAGIKPTYPETGYGYIRMGDSHSKHGEISVFHVDSFVEKPTIEVAREYVTKWEYLWNPALFFVRVARLLDLFKDLAPKHYEQLMRIKEVIGTDKEDEITKDAFEKMEKISIDYAIMEKAPNLYVAPLDLGWADIGHWKSIYDVFSQNDEHVIKGAKYVYVDSDRNLIFSTTPQLISTVGVSDTLVVVDKDAILICNAAHAQKVKELVKKISQSPDTQHFA